MLKLLFRTVALVAAVSVASLVHALDKNAVEPSVVSGGHKTTADCCGLVAGDRVMLTVDNPDGANGLLAGAVGTVICCDTLEGVSPLLISWDGWTDGHDNTIYCYLPASPTLGPSDSHWWIDCDQVVALDDAYCGYEVGDRVQVMFDNSNGATNLPKGSTGTVVCASTDAPGDEVVVAFENWNDGDDSPACLGPEGPGPYSSTSWSIPCVDLAPLPENCGLEVGDRVRFMGGGGPGSLDVGTMGTVVCTGINSGPSYEYYAALVSWDGWSSGHDQTNLCATPPDYQGASDSHYWMRCTELGLIENVDCGFAVGDRIELTVDGPDGNESLLTGHRGTVVCISTDPGLDYNLLVSWDSWADGHDPFFACDEPSSPSAGPADSHWFVKCDEVKHLGACTPERNVGDRVIWNVPDDGPPVGTAGSIVCIDESNLPNGQAMLVSWDYWEGGHDLFNYCDADPEEGSDKSHWWARCSELLDADACGFKKGDRVVLRVSDPDGGGLSEDPRGLPLGREGIVSCTNTGPYGVYDLLVRWDDFEMAGNGTTNCDEVPLTGADGVNAWWVHCNEVRPAPYNGWDHGDYDQNRCTDLSDFLFLMDGYQTHTFLSDFLTVMDNWQKGARCP